MPSHVDTSLFLNLGKMSLQEFSEYVTNSGVDFDTLTVEQKRNWRETFDRSRQPSVQRGNYLIHLHRIFLASVFYLLLMNLCDGVNFIAVILFIQMSLCLKFNKYRKTFNSFVRVRAKIYYASSILDATDCKLGVSDGEGLEAIYFH